MEKQSLRKLQGRDVNWGLKETSNNFPGNQNLKEKKISSQGVTAPKPGKGKRVKRGNEGRPGYHRGNDGEKF